VLESLHTEQKAKLSVITKLLHIDRKHKTLALNVQKEKECNLLTEYLIDSQTNMLNYSTQLMSLHNIVVSQLRKLPNFFE
jgi:hypothetical protein